MKKILLAIVAVFMLGAFSASAQKLGHFDYLSVMDTLDTYKKAYEQKDELEKDFEETMKVLGADYEQKYIALQGGYDTLPDILLQMRQQELAQIEALSQQKQQEFQQSLQIIQERYIDPMEKWLKEAVEIVGKREGLDYILYFDENATFFWVNPDRGRDVTDAVITEMLRLEKENPIAIPGQ